MKPKTSPTSPKAVNNKSKDKDLDNYYKDSLSNIVKPQKKRTPIWFLFLVIIFGFMAGILGQLVLLSYGSEIPYLEKLDVFSLTEDQPFYISLGGDKGSTSVTEINKIIENERNSIVQIFQKKDAADEINNLYIPENQLGLAIAITNDGYLMTTNQIISDSSLEYVAITENNEIYLVNEILTDPSSDFLILKTDINNLKAPSMIDYSDLANSEEILLVDKYGFGTDPQTQITSIKDKDFKLIKTPEDYFSTTERLDDLLLLETSDISGNSIAYAVDGQAIGFTAIIDNSAVIYPFYLIESKITATLENDEIIRPYLGITYISLANTANISADLSQDKSKGALIYFDENGEFPGIISNSPAEKAGLESNDIILSINNQVINGHVSFNKMVQDYNAGDVITLTIFRDGSEKEIKITLESII